VSHQIYTDTFYPGSDLFMQWSQLTDESAAQKMATDGKCIPVLGNLLVTGSIPNTETRPSLFSLSG
jgi:hypothetical protein